MKSSDVHIEQALSNFAVSIIQNSNFVSDILMPPQPVIFESDKFWIFGNEELKYEYNLKRADGAPAVELDSKMTEGSYATDNYSGKQKITRRQKNNADSIVRLQQKTTRRIVSKIRLAMEIDAEALLNDTGTFEHDSPATKWDDTSPLPDIMGDIDAAYYAFFDQAGIEPNYIVIPSSVARVMAADSTLLGLQMYTKNNLIEGIGIPLVIRNMKVVIPGSRMVTTEPGITEVVGRVWRTDNVGLYYVDPLASEDAFTVGVQFRIRLNGLDVWIKSWDDPNVDATWYEGNMQNGGKIIAAEAGYIIDNVLT